MHKAKYDNGDCRRDGTTKQNNRDRSIEILIEKNPETRD